MKSLLCAPVLLLLIGLTSCEKSLITARVGPEETERLVVIHPGQPGRVAENESVKVEFFDAGAKQFHQQDIGGWRVMPPDHFDALMARLKELEALEKKTQAEPEK